MLRTDKIESALRNFRVHTAADFHEHADPTKLAVKRRLETFLSNGLRRKISDRSTQPWDLSGKSMPVR